MSNAIQSNGKDAHKAQYNQIPFQDLWSAAYRDLYYRESYDCRARCGNSCLKALEQIERDGMVPKLYAIVSEIFV